MARLAFRRIFALVAVLPAALAAQQRAMEPNDWHRVSTVGSATIAPDGKRIAFTVTTVVERENRRHSEIWVVPTAGGTPQRWTSPSTESSNPRWSPDGKYLIFTSQRPGGRGATWFINASEPAGEAFQMEYPTLGSLPADKSFSVFAATTDTANGGGGGGGGRGGRGGGGAPQAPAGQPGAMSIPPFGAITKPVDQARFDGRHIVQFPYKGNGLGYLANPRQARRYNPTQVFTQKFDGSARVQLTQTNYSHRDVQVSPDGKWVAFVADAKLRSDSVVQAEADSLALLPFDKVRDAAPRNDNEIFVMPVAGGEPRKLATIQGDESQLEWSPDSRSLAFISRPTRTSNAILLVADATSGATRNMTPKWQYEPANAYWLANGNMLVVAQIGGRGAFFSVDVKAGAYREVVGGRRVIRGGSMDDARAQMAFIASSVTKPTELFVMNADGSGERMLTDFNGKLNAEIGWADAERFTYKSVGNLEIEGWLMKPFGYQAGRKYPVVLYIHGGPHSQYDEGWFDEFQSLAGAGMMVLYTNPRGSSGYGADFTYITRGKWGGDDYLDLMKAVDIAAARPDVDSTRMGVTGGSYGGFMTAWVTTKTNRFKAAQTDRMISNWVSWYSVSDAQGLTEFEFYGKPWENPAMYDTLSPIKYVAKVKTPTLMVQSEEDFRTPMPEADQWFMSLKKRGVPVEWVRYPRSTHDLSRTGEPWLLVDRLGRLRQWFAYWLKP
jgi:dipeptidyl aminopeptidase/acylaminoacyl peptidase